jgi:hypothetical protein
MIYLVSSSLTGLIHKHASQTQLGRKIKILSKNRMNKINASVHIDCTLANRFIL